MSAEEAAPDLWDPDLECGARAKRLDTAIGVSRHTHVCREPADHDGLHTCTCAFTWGRP